MINNLQEFRTSLESNLVTTKSPNHRPPSWPPPRDWPVVIDQNGIVISRWGDPRWDLSAWAGRKVTFNFGDGEALDNRRKADPLDSANADLMRMVATWLVWGTHAATALNSIFTYFHMVRPIVALCSQNGISASKLMRFPKVFEQVPSVIAPSSYRYVITVLHRLYDARDMLGFTIIDPAGLRRLAAAAPGHDPVQTPYIPPRIWLYQLRQLRECLTDFTEHRQQIEACFQFCLDQYVKKYGTLEAAIVIPNKISPFNSCVGYRKDYPGTFADVAVKFGIADILTKWGHQFDLGPRAFSNYFSMVTFAGMAYVCNFTLQRRQEVASLRTSCLHWEVDEELGRVPIICGETTKTDPDSDARWIASPSVEIAIEALSTIARLRMICDIANPAIQPTLADQRDPYLASTATEPWGNAFGCVRPYNIRRTSLTIGELTSGRGTLFDPEQMRITTEDLAVARRLTPNLPVDAFAAGKVWPLTWHQYRRTGAVNMFASGDISDSTMQQQMKHSSRLMPLYYGRNHGHLHLNKETQAAVVMAMYQAQAETLAVVATKDDRFISPHGPGHRAHFAMNVLSVNDKKQLIKMAKGGSIAFREHRLGGCMKAGVCEYGGIESVARCAGGDNLKPCTDVLYDRSKEPRVRADLRRLGDEIKSLPAGHPRSRALIQECLAMENYLSVISAR